MKIERNTVTVSEFFKSGHTGAQTGGDADSERELCGACSRRVIVAPPGTPVDLCASCVTRLRADTASLTPPTGPFVSTRIQAGGSIPSMSSAPVSVAPAPHPSTAELLAMLRSLEWIEGESSGMLTCEICKMGPRDEQTGYGGHAPDCALAALLARVGAPLDPWHQQRLDRAIVAAYKDARETKRCEGRDASGRQCIHSKDHDGDGPLVSHNFGEDSR